MSDSKTNAMRILDRAGARYETVLYDCAVFRDAEHAAEASGVDLALMYKTLVGIGKSERYCVIVVPAGGEADLKKAAKALGEKSIELIPVKDINRVTGYERGGCSPLGLRRQCKIVVDASVLSKGEVYISGGRIGCSIGLDPRDLVSVSGAVVADIVHTV